MTHHMQYLQPRKEGYFYYLVIPVMFDWPNTDGNWDYAYKYKWNEDKNPHMAARGQLVAYEELKHKQYQVYGQAYQHCFVVDVSFPFQPEIKIYVEEFIILWKLII